MHLADCFHRSIRSLFQQLTAIVTLIKINKQSIWPGYSFLFNWWFCKIAESEICSIPV